MEISIPGSSNLSIQSNIILYNEIILSQTAVELV